MDNFEFDPFFSIFAALWMKKEIEEEEEKREKQETRDKEKEEEDELS